MKVSRTLLTIRVPIFLLMPARLNDLDIRFPIEETSNGEQHTFSGACEDWKT